MPYWQNLGSDSLSPASKLNASNTLGHWQGRCSAFNQQSLMPTEYISTLECDVAEHDQVIDVICTELGPIRSENAALQQEIKALKKALISSTGCASLPALPLLSPFPSLHHPLQLRALQLHLCHCSHLMYI
jgi:hypothetical protein